MIGEHLDDVTTDRIAEMPFDAHEPVLGLLSIKPRGMELPTHAHGTAQLTFAASGMVQVHSADGRWLMPPQLAVWVPAGVSHRVEALTDAERIGRLTLHELTETADAPTYLPWPTSPVGRRLADLAFKDHQNKLRFSELASRAATSVRSASRVFPAETGLTFKAWRQRARIVWANDGLGRGKTISWVSAASGFASTAAFSSAFRQVTALAPTKFLEWSSASDEA